MPLISNRLMPGQWRVERIGLSGAHYRLLYQGSRFRAISRRDMWRGPGNPWYWRRIFTSHTNAEVPHGKLVLAAFADIGVNTKLTVAGYISAQHVRLTRVD